jgi:hypothetical protein
MICCLIERHDFLNFYGKVFLCKFFEDLSYFQRRILYSENRIIKKKKSINYIDFNGRR